MKLSVGPSGRVLVVKGSTSAVPPTEEPRTRESKARPAWQPWVTGPRLGLEAAGVRAWARPVGLWGEGRQERRPVGSCREEVGSVRKAGKGPSFPSCCATRHTRFFCHCYGVLRHGLQVMFTPKFTGKSHALGGE